MSCSINNIKNSLLEKNLITRDLAVSVYNKLAVEKYHNNLAKQVRDKYNHTEFPLFTVQPILGYQSNEEVEGIYGKGNLYKIVFNNDAMDSLDKNRELQKARDYEREKERLFREQQRQSFEELRNARVSISEEGDVVVPARWNTGELPEIELSC